MGVHPVLADQNISVEVVTAGYDNATSVPTGVTVVATIVNEAFISPSISPGEKYIDTLSVGAVDSHNNSTPKIVGQFSFDPTEYNVTGTTRTLEFRAVAANGGGVPSTNVELYSISDAEVIATLNFTSATPTLASATLTEGAGAGEIDQAPKVYEVRIYVDSPDLVDDTIELGSAELRIVKTVN